MKPAKKVQSPDTSNTKKNNVKIGLKQLASLNIPVIVLISFLFYQCGSTTNADDGFFYYNEQNEITSLDPLMANGQEHIWPVSQLFNGLLKLDSNLAIKPDLAKSYSVSADGRRYTFVLRNNVYFNDDECFKNGKGRRLMAQDVEYSFNRLLENPTSGLPEFNDLLDRNTENQYTGMHCGNDSVFEIHLKQPYTILPKLLSMPYFFIVPHEAVSLYKSQFGTHPVGTGPFKFFVWEKGNALIFHKNKHYFETDAKGQHLPYLNGIHIRMIKDRETAFMTFLEGKTDLISGADAFNISELLQPNGNLKTEYTNRFVLQKHSYMKTDYIGVLTDTTLTLVKHSPLRFPLIRKALFYAIDRNALIRFIRKGVGIPASTSFVPNCFKAFNTSYTSISKDSIIKIFKTAGYTDLSLFPKLELYITDNYKEQAEFIQSEWSKIGIVCEIHIEPSAVLRQKVNRSELLLFKKSWIADYADPESFFSLFYSPNKSPKGVNYFRYENAAFDRLYQKALQTQSDSVKQVLYIAMNNLLMQDMPYLNLYYDEAIRLVGKRIQGLTMHALNPLDLKYVYKTPLNSK